MYSSDEERLEKQRKRGMKCSPTWEGRTTTLRLGRLQTTRNIFQFQKSNSTFADVISWISDYPAESPKLFLWTLSAHLTGFSRNSVWTSYRCARTQIMITYSRSAINCSPPLNRNSSIASIRIQLMSLWVFLDDLLTSNVDLFFHTLHSLSFGLDLVDECWRAYYHAIPRSAAQFS